MEFNDGEPQVEYQVDGSYVPQEETDSQGLDQPPGDAIGRLTTISSVFITIFIDYRQGGSIKTFSFEF